MHAAFFNIVLIEFACLRPRVFVDTDFIFVPPLSNVLLLPAIRIDFVVFQGHASAPCH